MTTDITYATIVPLIGGESIGLSRVLNDQNPEYVLSYSGFSANDEHYISYLRKQRGWSGDYVLIDEVSNYKPKRVDVVNTVCPCAGLSSLSPTFGHQNEKNEWMYQTAQYVLEQIQPRVFWGENAPRLFSQSGRPVLNKLYELARKYGYTLNVYSTKSMLHGIPQKRARTFYFFVQEENRVPIFRYYDREPEGAEHVVNRPKNSNDSMNFLINKKDPYDNPWFAYCMHKHGVTTIRDLYESLDTSILSLVHARKLSNGNMLEVAEYLKANDFEEKAVLRAQAIQEKLDKKMNYWHHGNIVPKGISPALTRVDAETFVNPFEEKYITIRDCFRLMGLPDDMELERPRHLDAIFQNVPVGTATDMMRNVISYLEGTCEMTRGTLIRQSNIDQKIVELDSGASNSLEKFFTVQTQLKEV